MEFRVSPVVDDMRPHLKNNGIKDKNKDYFTGTLALPPLGRCS
jgi:hypothetical protein